VIKDWTVAFLVVGMILRFGQSAEILTWGLNYYVVMAVSGAFFPVAALPVGLRWFADLLPTTHAFGAAREVLQGDPVPWGRLSASGIGTVVFLGLSLLFCGWMLRVFRSRGFVTRYC
jgi:ABC-2 type transport system permease protein